MENLLIMGISTRPMIKSAKSLNYNTYSISYFKTLDFEKSLKEKHILHQENINSCGLFEENYSPQKLLELSKEYLYQIDENKEIDKIVFSTGITANDFKGKFSKFKNKIKGNLNVENIEDKFRMYNKIKNKFNVPMTFKPTDIDELKEIIKQHEDLEFILKPNQGSGGLGIIHLNKDSYNQLNNEEIEINKILQNDYILQEHITGDNLSSSVLSSSKEQKTIINSKLITENDLGIKNSYVYSGNIIPLDKTSFNKFKKNTKEYSSEEILKLNKLLKRNSEEIINKFKLIGSNGVDFILKDSGKKEIDEKNLYLIEVNPRLQGTYELCEESLGINMLEGHIKACEGEIINIPTPKQYSIKKIIYAKNQVKIDDLAIDNVYDIPYNGVKIEKNQPIATIISSNENLEIANKNKEIANKKIEENIQEIK